MLPDWHPQLQSPGGVVAARQQQQIWGQEMIVSHPGGVAVHVHPPPLGWPLATASNPNTAVSAAMTDTPAFSIPRVMRDSLAV
ncbi:MAG: hypothetical protein JNK35_08400 [Phycisphaerae bacterium]|nr:hypothetical protein [Phycisphaerae bacterium]